jgi:hypothetical protein
LNYNVPSDVSLHGREPPQADSRWGIVTHRFETFVQEAMSWTHIPPVRRHELDQPDMLVDSLKQVFPVAADPYVCLIDTQ